MAEVFRQPLTTRTPGKRAADQTFRPPNLLLTTLAVVAAAAPFVTEWENPRTKARVQPPLTVSGRPPNTIPPPYPAGRAQVTESPVARRIARPAEQPPNLLPDTLAPVVAGEFPPGRTSDFPNPVRAKALLRVNHHRSAYDPPPQVFPLPVARQLDWPNPLVRKSLAGLEGGHVRYFDEPDYLLRSLQRDWPNPTVRRHAQPPQLVANRLVNLLFAAQPVPVGRQLDWPNPVPRKAQVRGDADGNALLSTLFVQPPFPPGRQLDWTNPRLPKWQVRGDVESSLLVTTLFVPPAAFPPGRQQDWPNPVKERWPEVSYTFSGTPLPNDIPPALEVQGEADDENRRRRRVIHKVSRESVIEKIDRSTGVRKKRRDTRI